MKSESDAEDLVNTSLSGSLEEFESYDVSRKETEVNNASSIGTHEPEPWNWNSWEAVSYNLWLIADGFYCFLNLRLCLSAFILYYLTSRWFFILPFATEAFINYVTSIFLLCVAQRRDNTFGIITMKLSLLVWLIIDMAVNSFLLNRVFIYIKWPYEIIYEPDGVLNSDWGYLLYVIYLFVAMTFATIFVELVLLNFLVASLFSRQILEFFYRKVTALELSRFCN